MWQRRAFLRAAGAGFASLLLPQGAEALERSELVFASAALKPGGGYAAALVNETGALITSVDLPDRGHDIVFSPTGGQAVAFARQPGTFAVVFDTDGKAPPQVLDSVAGRHFFGHGAFSPDGQLLYATENDFDNSCGVIGVYDVAGGYRRIGEFDTGGVGAHEMLLMPDGGTLVIANGGIETHPDYGRAELNIDTMEPSISFVDRRSGAMLGLLKLDAGLHQLSIRHMAIDRRGRVWFGCQYKGDSADRPQLVGYATLDGEIRLVHMPDNTLDSLRNYVGSVAATTDGGLIGISSPVGNNVIAIDPDAGAVVATLGLANGCGIAGDGAGLLASSGDGALVGFAGSDAAMQHMDIQFDNHLRLRPRG